MGNSQTTDAVAEFNAAVNAQMSDGMNRAKAIYAVIQGDEDLHRRYLLAVNKDRPKAIAHLQ